MTQGVFGFREGGAMCPLGKVISGPPPFGLYWPEDGAGFPGLTDFAMSHSSSPALTPRRME